MFQIRKWYIIYAVLFAAMIISFLFDNVLLDAVSFLRTEILDMFFKFITHGFFVFALLVIFSIFTAMYKDKIKTIGPIWLCAILSLAFAFILKYFFLSPRPEIVGLVNASGPGFPSAHAAVIFSTLPFLFYHNKFSKSIKYIWLVIAIFVAFSRVYAGVHFLSDIFGGIILGLIVGKIVAYFVYQYPYFDTTAKREIKRQAFHMLLGLVLVLLIYLDILTSLILLLIVIIGIILSYLTKIMDVPVFSWFLAHFERPADLRKVPGKGTLFYFLGITLTVLLFDKQVALAAIAIFVLGDSISHIVGRQFGKIKIPYNKDKMLEGSIVGFLFAFVAGAVFVPLSVAAIGAAIAMAIETAQLKTKRLHFDDNLILPVVTAFFIGLFLAIL